MKIRFLYCNKPLELETDGFLDPFHKASMAYACKTGRVATHLALGETEWMLYQGYVAWLKSAGFVRSTDTNARSFEGLILLRSAERSLIAAMEQEKA